MSDSTPMPRNKPTTAPSALPTPRGILRLKHTSPPHVRPSTAKVVPGSRIATFTRSPLTSTLHRSSQETEPQNKLSSTENTVVASVSATTVTAQLKPTAGSIRQPSIGHGYHKDCQRKTPAKITREKTATSLQLSSDRHSVDSKFAGLGKKRSRSSFDLSFNKPTITGMSTNTSTITIDNVSIHKAGQIPQYLKKNDKKIMETKISVKKKGFITQKNKLIELQTTVLEAHKELNDLMKKYNKTFENELVQLDNLELIAVVKNSQPTMLIKSTEDGPIINFTGLQNLQLKMLNDNDILDQLEHKIKSIHATGFKLCQLFIDRNFKFVGTLGSLKESGDYDDVSNQMNDIFKEMEQNILNEEIEQMKRIASFMADLKNLFITDKGIPIVEKDTLLKELAAAAHKPTTELENHIKTLKRDLELSEVNRKLFEKKYEDEVALIKELNTQLAEFETKYTNTQKDFENISNRLQQSECYAKQLENQLEIKSQEINNKANEELKEITDLKQQIKESEIKVIDYVKQIELLQNQIESLKTQSNLKVLELMIQLETEQNERNRVLKELNETKSSLVKLNELHEKMSVMVAGINDATKEKKLLTDNESLKSDISKLRDENTDLRSQLEQLAVTKEDDFETEFYHQQEEIKNMQILILSQQAQLAKKEKVISKKIGKIRELEAQLSTEENQLTFKLKEELYKLRDSELEKKREIEQLRYELSRATADLKQQEESIYMHQRLLRIRSELISSMQEKEDSTKCQLNDLYTEMSKKTTLMNQMNHEISAKAEELQNLFSTLGTKQLEVSRQDHIIRMLEENNERNQRIRVCQEERIAKLEYENMELKQILLNLRNNQSNIVEYYDHTKNPMRMDESDLSACNPQDFDPQEDLVIRDYCADRRNKRQTDIRDSSVMD